MSFRALAAMLMGLTVLSPACLAAEPGSTLDEDVKTLKVALVEGYVKARPRVLIGAENIASLKAKPAAQEELWGRVLASARRLGDSAPDAKEVETGAHYWRIERVQAGALAYVVTGEKAHRDRAVRWMLKYCAGDVWGTGYRDNRDLQAAWYLYHIATAYDMLHTSLTPAERKAIRTGLAEHAEAMYDSLAPSVNTTGFRYDQNHTYIPTIGLATTALALMGEEPRAEAWLTRSAAIMARSRHVLGTDGYYYEGTGYWAYALNWHVRYADLMARATGDRYHDLPILAKNWLMPLHLSLPGAPKVFDVGDVGHGLKDGKRSSTRVNQHSMFWSLASVLKSPKAQLIGNQLEARWPEQDYPTLAFLRFDPSIKPTKLADIKPYHHFADHGIVSWRSGWGDDATVLLYRSGPPMGHAAAAKVKRLTDWTMNCGHTHPDIGSFWLYARGAYLAVDTGYTAKKYTRDHNTLTIDGVGQGMDGSYWNERGYPYERFDQCRVERAELSKNAAVIAGEFSGAYPARLGLKLLRRTMKVTRNYLLIVDDMQADGPRTLDWYCHTDMPFRPEGAAYVARSPRASLAVIPLAGGASFHTEKTTVIAGNAPGKGKPAQRGWQLRCRMKAPAVETRLAHLVVPLGAKEGPPVASAVSVEEKTIRVALRWSDGRREIVRLDIAPKKR